MFKFTNFMPLLKRWTMKDKVEHLNPGWKDKGSKICAKSD